MIPPNKKKAHNTSAFIKNYCIVQIRWKGGGVENTQAHGFFNLMIVVQEMMQHLDDCFAKGSELGVPHKLGMSASLVVVTN